jgi:hypothetical protein
MDLHMTRAPAARERLTPAQLRVLGFLDDKMWSSTKLIGEGVFTESHYVNRTAAASRIVGALARIGLIHRLPDIGLWRISPDGRDALNGQRDASGG